jgi:hypothetical protein
MIDAEHLKLLFSLEGSGNVFNCKECKYKMYIACCPEEGDCQIASDYTVWLEKGLIRYMNKYIQSKG